MQASFAQLPLTRRHNALWIIAVVLLLHVAAFYVLMQLKLPKRPVTDNKPIQVRIVQIKQQLVATPQPPKAQSKVEPQPKPKPITPEQPKPQPKVIAAEKPIVKTTTVVSKVEQVAPSIRPTPTQPAPIALPVQAQKSTSTTKVEAVPQGPKKVQIGGNGVQWSRSPNLSYSNRDLAGQNRKLSVLIDADEKGRILDVQIVTSSGLSALDEKVMRSVRNAKFKPYKENGQALAIRAEQPFELSLTSNN